jgi:hypothetical protein
MSWSNIFTIAPKPMAAFAAAVPVLLAPKMTISGG